MLYPKNVPNYERIIRIVIGLALIGVSVWQVVAGNGGNLLIMGTLIGSALFIMITGFVGWCPACAMVGRKLKAKQTH